LSRTRETGQRLWRIWDLEISHTQLSRGFLERGNWAGHPSKPPNQRKQPHPRQSLLQGESGCRLQSTSRANEDGSNLKLEIFTPDIVASRQRNDRRATQTFDSIVTCPRLRIPTSSPIQTWSPTTKRHGKEIFTLLAMPTPFPNLRSERAEQGRAEGRPPGTGILKENAAYNYP